MAGEIRCELIVISIRDLLHLTVIVALAVGWWVERRALLAARAELAEERMKQEVSYRQQEAPVKHAQVRAQRAAAMSAQGPLNSSPPAPNPSQD